MPAVGAYRCGACAALFEVPDGPLWECSRCGNEQTGEGENRCRECYVFMAKVAEECCPDCGNHEGIEGVDAWRGTDGELYASEAAEAEWAAGAPERAAAKAASDEFLERLLAERRAETLERNARLLPRMRALTGLLGEQCPRLRQAIAYNTAAVERDPAATGTGSAMLFFEELAGLFASDLAAELATARDFDQPREARGAAEEAVRARILARLPATLTERMQGSVFSSGSGIGFDMETVVDGMLGALDREGAP